MRTNKQLVQAVSAAIVGTFISITAMGQGSLTPPGAPAPMMKTLDQIEPRIPISSVPYTITQPGSYYLTGNLMATNLGGVRIQISSDNVVLDLNGFTIGGNYGDVGIMIGVNDTGNTNGYRAVTIKNGSFEKLENTLYAHNAIDCTFENLRFKQCGEHAIYFLATSPSVCRGNVVQDCSFGEDVNVGVRMAEYGGGARNYGNVVRRCTFVQSNLATVNAITVDGTGCTIEDCTVQGGGWDGISVGSYNVVRNCQIGGVKRAAINLMAGATGTRIENNNCSGSSIGIMAESTSGNYILGNTSVGNATNINEGYGNTVVPVEGASDRIPLPESRILTQGRYYFLTNNVVLPGMSPWGLPSDITLDLNGFTIGGNIPLNISGARTKVCNGVIIGNLVGVDIASGASDITLEGLTISSSPNEDGGIVIGPANRVMVKDCKVSYGIGIGQSLDVTIDHCELTAVGVSVWSSSNSVIRDCTIRNAPAGISVYGTGVTEIRHNQCQNVTLGINIAGSTNSIVMGNLCTGCATSYAMGTGGMYGTIVTNRGEVAISPDVANFSF